MLPAESSTNPPSGMPDGVVPVPLGQAQTAAPIRICVAFRQSSREAGSTPLIVLREEFDSTAYLGCLVDARNAVLDWLEIRIQKPECLLRAWGSGDEVLTNRDLDARWVAALRLARERDRGLLVATGWEEVPPLPLFIDAARAAPWHPQDPGSGASWVLCRDDGALEAAGLPTYSGSAARYLYLAGGGGGPPRFVPTMPGAPATGDTAGPETVFGDPMLHVPVNPWAGFVLVRRFIPTTLAEYVDVLNGKPWSEVARHPDVLPASLHGSVLLDSASRSLDRGRLFVAHHGLGARLLETLCLKLLLFQSVLCELRDVTEALGRPLLNLTDESFRILFGTDSSEAPFLWSARAVLTDTGSAVAIRIPGVENAFASLSRGLAVPYTPVAARAPFTGSGSVRIRAVQVQADCVVMEGTLAASGALQEVISSDLIRMRLTTDRGPLDLSARGDEQAALAENEARFLTHPVPATGEARRWLQALEGVRFPRVPFQVIPCLSTPCDLYSAGVLACRIVLQSPTARLAEVLDEVQGLSHQLGQEQSSEALGARVRRLAEKEPRWLEVLGPQRLAGGEVTPAAALEAIPAGLWFDLLGAVARLFPDMGPHSICKSYSDVQPGGLHRVFVAALGDFRDLTARVRSLLLNDFTYNREVRSVIRDLLAAGEQP